MPQAIERRVHEIGRELLEHAAGSGRGLVATDRLMQWTMRDPGFKTQLFRFVDAFPTLRSPEDVHAHLVDYLTQPDVTLPPGLATGLKAGALAKGATTRVVTRLVTAMAETFIGGTDPASALATLRALWKEDVAFTVDVLGEACVSDGEADVYRDRYLDLIDVLAGEVARWPSRPALESDHLGPIPRANVSVKLSALAPDLDAIAPLGSIDRLMVRLRPLLESAARRGVFVNFDMESHQLKDLTLAAFIRAAEEVDFEGGLALQAYLRSGDADARRIADWASATGRVVTVRLVKGAYWDYETIHAEMLGWPVPVWSRRADTDACFERMVRILLDATPHRPGEPGVKLALGSHNARSVAVALAEAEQLGLPPTAVEVQVLHGMAGPMRRAAAGLGLRRREYVPVGEMVPGMAYLVRRLLENTSNESWVVAADAGPSDAETLLASPHIAADQPDPGVERIDRGAERHLLTAAVPGVGNGRPFMTEPIRDFADRATREAFAAAVSSAVVPKVTIDATVADADRAVGAARAAFPTWRDRDPVGRADVISRVAALLRARRDDLAGVMVKEVGKGWRSADADVTEAIDFCEYYARMSVELFRPRRLGRFVGERDDLFYQPRGVAAVIAPWNFPLAILTGMSIASLAAGNTVVLKPANQSMGIARRFWEILREAGVPEGAAQFLAGPGRTVGAHLVRHPDVAVIAFTGSKAVGLDIIAAAGLTPDEQPHVKRVVCEMGGKNAIIVDTSADLDAAVLGVRESAFGFQGQKCSACSRVIVLSGVYDQFVDRLVASTASLIIGDPTDPGTHVGPVIDGAAARQIEAYIETGRSEATLVLAMDLPAEPRLMNGRHYVAPHIFVDVSPDATIAREEIFGPVLSVLRADDFGTALDLANASSYKLTGGVYSRRPAHLARARAEFRVGNLYLNRGITGALVGRQPFGGFGMSGVGSKAGGPDYLKQFVEPRVVTENTMRRGFAPDL